MWFLQCALFALLFVNSVNSQKIIPPQKIIVTEKGFRISIPDASGTQTFFFQGNFNKNIDFLDPDVVIMSATAPTNGEWVLEHNKKGLKTGDIINYWIHIRKNDIDYTSKRIRYQIEGAAMSYKFN